MKPEELLRRLRAGHTANVPFEDFCRLVEGFGFELTRVAGSHHIYVEPRVALALNLQPLNGEVKGFQAKQFLKLVDRNGLEWRGGHD